MSSGRWKWYPNSPSSAAISLAFMGIGGRLQTAQPLSSQAQRPGRKTGPKPPARQIRQVGKSGGSVFGLIRWLGRARNQLCQPVAFLPGQLAGAGAVLRQLDCPIRLLERFGILVLPIQGDGQPQ